MKRNRLLLLFHQLTMCPVTEVLPVRGSASHRRRSGRGLIRRQKKIRRELTSAASDLVCACMRENLIPGDTATFRHQVQDPVPNDTSLKGHLRVTTHSILWGHNAYT